VLAKFYKKVEEIVEQKPRYKSDAYEFVMQALWYTQDKLKRKGHISTAELLEGIRQFAVEQYGLMSRQVLAHWGVKKTSDFGNIVFDMIDKGLMSKNDSDSLNDFKEVFDFKKAFNPVWELKLDK
jgi:uncharacterized repeat protein (TIGR04138 family)